MPQIIDGKAISAQIKDELKKKVEVLKETRGISVCLAVIQVGSDPASTVYVGNKKKACAYIGIDSLSYELPEETTQEELSEDDRYVLDAFYNEDNEYGSGMADDVADYFGIERASAYRRKNRALAKLTTLLFGKP